MICAIICFVSLPLWIDVGAELTDTQIEFRERPLNTVVVQNDMTRLTCRVRSILGGVTFHWQFVPSNSPAEDKQEIYTGMEVNKKLSRIRFSVNTSEPGHGDLHIKQIRITDAGTYECKIMNKHGQYKVHRAQLIVLDSNPSCSSDMKEPIQEGDVIHFQSSVIYKGNMNLSIVWFNTINESVNSSTKISGSTVSTAILTSMLTLAVGSSHNGAKYMSRTVFQYTDDFPDNCATNVPGYQFVCPFPVLNIFSKPKLVTVIPKKFVYNPGDRLECNAVGGHPVPAFFWIDSDDGSIIINGSILDISHSLVNPDRVYSYLCIAWNEDGFGGKWNSSIKLQFAVELPTRTITDVNEEHKTLMIVVVACVSVAFVISVISCLLCVHILHARKTTLTGVENTPPNPDSEVDSSGSSNSASHVYDSIDTRVAPEGHALDHLYANSGSLGGVDSAMVYRHEDEELVEINLVNIRRSLEREASRVYQQDLQTELRGVYEASTSTSTDPGSPSMIYNSLNPYSNEKSIIACCCN